MVKKAPRPSTEKKNSARDREKFLIPVGTAAGITQAIPPAYTGYLGAAALAELGAAA